MSLDKPLAISELLQVPSFDTLLTIVSPHLSTLRAKTLLKKLTQSYDTQAMPATIRSRAPTIRPADYDTLTLQKVLPREDLGGVLRVSAESTTFALSLQAKPAELERRRLRTDWCNQ